MILLVGSEDGCVTNKLKGQVLVVAQFVLLALLVALPHAQLWLVSEEVGNTAVIILMIGLSITLFGIVSLGNSLTATPVPKESAILRTSGMYAIVRHPIYLGLILVAFGLVIPSGSGFTILVFVLFLGLLSYKARFEEKLLLAKYPEYADYAARVGRLFPLVGRIRQ
jgi:protein-S-isoprenylcysteine O-methyltransferase Ste14